MQENTDESNEKLEIEDKKPKSKSRLTKAILMAVSLLIVVIIIIASYAGYIYKSSPEVIRNPKLEHYHFRMQILVDGKAEDFSTKTFQTEYAKDQCSADLPEQPIHFHDNKDQFVHIHWEGMTGGMVMKYYGWNYIGGVSNALGYRFDNIKDPKKVPIHGNDLPKVPKDDIFYVYTGDENGYKEHSFNDWTTQDLETFFNKVSNFPAHNINKGKSSSLLNWLMPNAYADESTTSTNGGTNHETEEEKLTRINNLLGNVVIFVQKDKPTDQQIKERFSKLLPLENSTCGG